MNDKMFYLAEYTEDMDQLVIQLELAESQGQPTNEIRMQILALYKEIDSLQHPDYLPF